MGGLLLAPFVGRGRELVALRGAMDDGHRLVTITGVAGIGKTRLLRELIGEEGSRSLCDLTDARRREDLEASVAGTLEADADVGRALASRGAFVLALDSCDGLEPAAVEALAEWLGACPELRIVATSRRVLQAPSELIYEIGPLPLEARDDGPSDAAALWEERVAQARPGYRIEDDDPEAVARIVAVLEGVPLAIELAAPRMRVTGSRALLAMLEQDLSALGPSRRHPPRHRSLESALAGSWASLSDAEREALSACAVFAGGFTVESAAAVVARGDALELLTSLRERSLVREHPRSTPRAVRLGLYRSVREFVTAKTAAAARRDAEQRHAAYYLETAEDWVRRLQTTGQRVWMRSMRLEQENLLALAGRSPLERSLRALIVVHMLPFHQQRRSGEELTSALERAERSDELGAEVVGVAHLLHAYFRYEAGDYEGADASLRLARAHAARSDDERFQIMVASYEGSIHSRRRRYEAADEAYARVVERSRGTAYERIGRIAEVRRARDRLLGGSREVDIGLVVGLAQTARETEDANLLLNALECAGRYFVEVGQHESATATLEELLALSTAMHSSRLPWIARLLLGLVDLDRGRAQEAEEAFRAARRLTEVLGDREPEAMCLRAQAVAQWLRGDVAGALGAVRAARSHDPSARRLERVIAIDGGAGLATPEEVHVGDAFASLAEARHALARGELAEAERSLDQADSGGAPEMGLSAPEERAVQSLLETRVSGLRAQVRARDPDATLVAIDGAWLRAPGAERVAVGGKRVLRNLLASLARRAGERPSTVLPAQALLEAGWPGERMRPESGRRRLEVSISRLRKLGLGEALLTEDGGYRLGDECVVVQSGAITEGGAGGTRK